MQRMLSVAKLVGVCGEIEGRKKFQKIVHLLREAGFQHEFSHRFGYLHYGPYSNELRAELDALTGGDGLVVEAETQKGARTTFVYTPSEPLQALLEELDVPSDPAWADMARQLNAREAQELEAISTVVYLRRLGQSGDHLRAKFLSLKPALAERLDRAIAESERLVPTA